MREIISRAQNPFDIFDRKFPSIFDDDFTKRFVGFANHMKTDMKEEDDKFILDIELPGFKKENVKINLEDGILQVSATRDVEKKDDKYVLNERHENVSRSYNLGEDADETNASASYDGGVLHVEIKKKEKPITPVNYIPIN